MTETLDLNSLLGYLRNASNKKKNLHRLVPNYHQIKLNEIRWSVPNQIWQCVQHYTLYYGLS